VIVTSSSRIRSCRPASAKRRRIPPQSLPGPPTPPATRSPASRTGGCGAHSAPLLRAPVQHRARASMIWTPTTSA
jgi:hypothetical protein